MAMTPWEHHSPERDSGGVWGTVQLHSGALWACFRAVVTLGPSPRPRPTVCLTKCYVEFVSSKDIKSSSTRIHDLRQP